MKKFIDEFKEIDDSIVKIMKSGFKCSFIICLIATYILFLYILNPVSHTIFSVGYLIAKWGLTFFVCFFVGAFASDKIRKVTK